MKLHSLIIKIKIAYKLHLDRLEPNNGDLRSEM